VIVGHDRDRRTLGRLTRGGDHFLFVGEEDARGLGHFGAAVIPGEMQREAGRTGDDGPADMARAEEMDGKGIAFDRLQETRAGDRERASGAHRSPAKAGAQV
jgi:hypothetical protein